ncbi:MAG: type II toxin-antitoxin system Phd/YefM family antitoxin [Mariprofundaceae bacterium]
MKEVYSRMTASISELKRNPSAVLHQAAGEPVVILNHNRPTAYLVPANTWETMMEMLEDAELAQLARERAHERHTAVPVDPETL